jgi:hypothetical protein
MVSGGWGIDDEGSDQEVYLAIITLYTISPISHPMKIITLTNSYIMSHLTTYTELHPLVAFTRQPCHLFFFSLIPFLAWSKYYRIDDSVGRNLVK